MNNLISLDGFPMSSILRKCAKKLWLSGRVRFSSSLVSLVYFLLLIIYFLCWEVGKKRAVMDNVMTVNPVSL